jgi:hypothetical protein
MEIGTVSFVISIILWLFITIRYTIPQYKEVGKLDMGGLLAVIILLTWIGVTLTALVIQLFYNFCLLGI